MTEVWKWFSLSMLTTILRVGVTVSFYGRRNRHREVRRVVQVHSVRNWRSQSVGPGEKPPPRTTAPWADSSELTSLLLSCARQGLVL